jgi:DNA-binding response OmpR family regulator
VRLVILTTRYSSVVTTERTQEIGIEAVLTKPFTARQLAAALQSVLARR